MDLEELKQKLVKAKEFICEVEDIDATINQCVEGYQFYQRKIGTLVLIQAGLVIWCVIVFFAGLSADGGFFYNLFIWLLIGVGVMLIGFFLIKKRKAKYLNELNEFSNKSNQYSEHLQKRLDEDSECVDFLPSAYQNSDAVSFIEEAIRTGAAPSMDSAIQQYHSYAARVENQMNQMAFAEYAQRMEAKVEELRDDMNNRY